MWAATTPARACPTVAAAAERLAAIRAILLDAARRAEDLGLTLCVENVRSCFGNKGVNTAAILAAVDHPNVRAIWDPANDFVSGGEDFRPGYEATKPWMVHVHAKDATEIDAATGLTAWTAIGAGDLDWTAQICALIDDGYGGHISLETTGTRRAAAARRTPMTHHGPAPGGSGGRGRGLARHLGSVISAEAGIYAPSDSVRFAAYRISPSRNGPSVG